MSSEKKSLIPDPPVPADRKYLILAGVFVLAFVLAFILAWALFRQDRAPIPTPDENAGLFPARVLDQEDLRVFIQAAEAEDYAALRDLG
ncbi:MAG: hypothetical protein FWG74_03395, partial [Planctomycetes bacterium]|nr:hypothetical protein [Planctomycetota bacterium]